MSLICKLRYLSPLSVTTDGKTKQNNNQNQTKTEKPNKKISKKQTPCRKQKVGLSRA